MEDEEEKNQRSSDLLDSIIDKEGLAEPNIYCFTTDDVPNAVKIGDTYRQIERRMNEWGSVYNNPTNRFLVSSRIKSKDENGKYVYFRDYSVHQYLDNNAPRSIQRLSENFFNDRNLHASREFYTYQNSYDEVINEINDAVKDINDSYESGDGRYDFYDLENLGERAPNHYPRKEKPTDLRRNQEEAVCKFIKAVGDGRTNLLMYATMRFGKTFTALMCAKKMNYKFILVLSAKANVKEEWKRECETHKNFEEYKYYDSRDIPPNLNDNAVLESLRNNEKIVLFLTLQDLNTTDKDFKKRHREIFKNRKVDMIIVDETHFGARAEHYGSVLKNSKSKKDEMSEAKKNNSEELDNLDTKEAIKLIDKYTGKSKLINYGVMLHLSGTPYRIMMSGEFNDEDIICTCQYDDILNEKEKWDEINSSNDEKWENPYFGFPKMIRFAYNPCDSIMHLLEEYQKDGYSYSVSELFRPTSIEESKNPSFIHQDEILELLKTIDNSGSENDLLGFLNYKKIKDASMCQHIVCVLPYKSSCDAFKKLLIDHKDKFTNLKYDDEQIINIAGFENNNKDEVYFINKISKLARQGKKTISLTVDKMLTGSTVPEWDTMLFFKDTSSPQEYDQAVFRLQNRYIETYKNPKTGKIIEYDKKPLTLLVDFCPRRMYEIDHQRAFFGNYYTNKTPIDLIDYWDEKSINPSPIIEISVDQIKEVKAVDINNILNDYRHCAGIRQDIEDIRIYYSMFSDADMLGVIEKQNEIGSKSGLSGSRYNDENNDNDSDNPSGKVILPNVETPIEKGEKNIKTADNKSDEINKKRVKQLQNLYEKLLLFAFLSDDNLTTIDSVLKSITCNDSSKRIAFNVGLSKDDIKILVHYLKENEQQTIPALNEKITEYSNLSSSNESPINKINRAVNKFGKFSEAAVYTPNDICNSMIHLLPKSIIDNLSDNKILDIASTAGEFAIAIYAAAEEYGLSIDAIKDSIYTIPKNKICYELVLKMYKMLGLSVNNISTFTAEDLLKIKETKTDKKGNVTQTNKIDYKKICDLLRQKNSFSKIKIDDEINEEDIIMKFDAVVGNPPYQLSGGSGGSNDSPIYVYFMQIANRLASKCNCLITKAAWLTSGRVYEVSPLREEMLTSKAVTKMVIYADEKEVFDGLDIEGGVCYYLFDNEHKGKIKNCSVDMHYENGYKDLDRVRNLSEYDLFIRDYYLNEFVGTILKKNNDFESMENEISGDTPFGIPSNPTGSKKNSYILYEKSASSHDVKLYYNDRTGRKTAYISRKDIKKNKEDIDSFKVFVPENLGDNHLVLGEPIVSDFRSVCSQTYLYIKNLNSEEEAENCKKYLKTKFLRALVLSIKITQSAPSRFYKFVPKLDFNNKTSNIDWSQSIQDIDRQLFKLYGYGEDTEIFKHIDNIIKYHKTSNK